MAKKFYGKQFAISENITIGLKRFFKKIDPAAREKASIAWGLQLINNTVLGQGGDDSRPPKKTGRLRGSGTVFVGSKKVGDTTFQGKDGTPAQSYTEQNENITTVGFNTPYAAKMHEELQPAGSLQPHADIAASKGKFLENHLKADRKDLLQLYKDIYKKNSGL